MYLFDVYSKREDLFLSQDAEKKLFTLLEESKEDVYVLLLKALLTAYDGIDRGVTFDQLRLLFKVKPITIKVSLSAFGCKLERDEFIELAEKYSGKGNILASLAGNFYDICLEYDVNPCLAYAWAVIETGGGTLEEALYNKDLFGMGANNSYDSAIKHFCEKVVNAGTPGTQAYINELEQAEKFKTENKKFDGTPDKNIYVLFCKDKDLGETHICDDPGYDNPEEFKKYCEEHKSNWENGGRYVIYHMYEMGGLYTGKYKSKCGHPNGTDPTTVAEQADYAQFNIETKIKKAKSIFGNGCFVGSYTIVEAAYEVANHYLDNGPVHYAGHSAGSVDNKRSVITGPGSVQRTWDIVPDDTARHGIVCATFVSLALWKAEVVKASWLESNGVSWHHINIGYALAKLPGWKNVGGRLAIEELKEGDVIIQPIGHIVIYVGGGKYIDQNYCAIKSNGSDTRRQLHTLSRDSIGAVLRYELNSD